MNVPRGGVYHFTFNSSGCNIQAEGKTDGNVCECMQKKFCNFLSQKMSFSSFLVSGLMLQLGKDFCLPRLASLEVTSGKNLTALMAFNMVVTLLRKRCKMTLRDSWKRHLTTFIPKFVESNIIQGEIKKHASYFRM